MSKQIDWRKYAIKCDDIYLGRNGWWVYETKDAIQVVTRGEAEVIVGKMPKGVQHMMNIVEVFKPNQRYK